MIKEVYTRRQGKTTIKPGQYLIVDAVGNNLEVSNRISTGAFVDIFKMDHLGNLNKFFF